jgi:hypothetical protein
LKGPSVNNLLTQKSLNNTHYRGDLLMRKVTINKVGCKRCNDIIESKHEHDFRRCKCGLIFIDGGTNQKYGLSVNQTEEKDKIENYIDFSLSVFKESE